MFKLTIATTAFLLKKFPKKEQDDMRTNIYEKGNINSPKDNIRELKKLNEDLA